MNLSSFKEILSNIRHQPKFSIFWLLTVCIITVFIWYGSGYVSEKGKQHASSIPNEAHIIERTIPVGDEWRRNLSDVGPEVFGLKVENVFTDQQIKKTTLLINTPETGRYSAEKIIVKKGYMQSFQSQDYFFIFGVKEINNKLGYIVVTLQQSKINT